MRTAKKGIFKAKGIFFFFTVIGVIIAWGSISAAQERSYELKFGTVFATEYPITYAVERAVKAVAQKTNGRLKIHHYPAAQLGGERDIQEAVTMGAVQGMMGGVGATYIDQRQTFYNYPYIFRDFDSLLRFHQTPAAKEFVKFNESHNLVEIDTWFRGIRHTNTTKKLINRLEDLKGLKIRVPESRAQIVGFEALGAKPTPMARPEVYTALQLGTLDGQESDVREMWGFGLYEVCKTIAITKHIVLGGSFFVNKKFFDSLPSDLKTALVEGVKEGGVWVRKEFEEGELKVLADLEKKGMTKTTPDLTPFRAATQKAFKGFGESVIGKDLFPKVVEDLAKTEKP
jgi:TRAP-type transport system periplasmic protein